MSGESMMPATDQPPTKRVPLNIPAFWWPLKDWRELVKDFNWCPGYGETERVTN